jgi:phage recombination protein Bet
MQTQVAKQETELTPAAIATLSQAGIIPPGTPPAIVQVFADACRLHGLSPFRKEIYLVPYQSKGTTQYTTIVGIDGLQQKAARTGRFAGVDEEQYDRMPDGTYKTPYQLKQANQRPVSCTVTIYAIVGGVRCPFTATAIFDEYYPAVAAGRDQYSKAATMPFNMIAKCARAKALKMAFSDELSGLHIEEEQAAFEDTTIEAAKVNPAASIDREELAQLIAACETTDDLQKLYRKNAAAHKSFAELFTARKEEILQAIEPEQNEQ